VTTPDILPDDVAALRALVLTAWAERDAERAENGRLAEERDQLAGQNDRLRHLLRQLQRMQFGRRSEKLDPDQFNLALEDLEQAVAEIEAEQEKADPALRQARSEKRRAGRGPLPAARCPSICRGSRSSARRKRPPAHAAAARCM
jgi:chromosome segregation ATPase